MEIMLWKWAYHYRHVYRSYVFLEKNQTLSLRTTLQVLTDSSKMSIDVVHKEESLQLSIEIRSYAP